MSDLNDHSPVMVSLGRLRALKLAINEDTKQADALIGAFNEHLTSLLALTRVSRAQARVNKAHESTEELANNLKRLIEKHNALIETFKELFEGAS